MALNDDFLIERYEKFELEDQINELKNMNEGLKKENRKLKKTNKKLKKENKHFKSTKAFKVWKKYAKIKEIPKEKKAKENSKAKEESQKGKAKEIPKEKKAKESPEAKNLKDIKVAIVCDQFTYDSFKYEFTPISLLPKNWKRKFKEEKPDLFFCEATWEGHNFKGNARPWRRKVIKYFDVEENRQTLLQILEYCRENNIPTIFWSKEDPPDYRTEKWSCAETAKEFDYIFTSSKECIPQYKKDFNHPNVDTLMFAAQPKLFNPLNLSSETIEELVFAGTYYLRYPDRCRTMEEIFDKAINEWGNLIIFDRNYYKTWDKFPEKYEKYIRPPIGYDEIKELYKKMEWGLNLNTVTDSETMFARRVFELALCNVNIITNYSKGVSKIFEDNVFYIEELDKLPSKDEDFKEKRLNNIYNVLENHTYTNRWKKILDTIDFPYAEDKDEISIIFKLNNLDELKELDEKFKAINYPNKHMNLLVSSNMENDVDCESIKEKYCDIENIYFENDEDYKKEIRKDIENKGIEYWIISDKDFEPDFIKKGILHYQYLNKRVSIAKGDEKFKLGLENGIDNKIINKCKLEYLDAEDPKIDTYYI